jgi:hypothetical protein
MPRYYFHLQSKKGREVDDHGIEFETLEQAIEDARRVAECAYGNSTDSKSVFEIADKSGQVLAIVPVLERVR